MSKNKLHFYFNPSSENYTIEKEEIIETSTLPESAFKILDINPKEKTVTIKRRFFKGVSSGEGIDAHKQRMSENCIKGFQSQHESKEILLFPSPHGIKDGDDFGRLYESKILPNGDWETTYEIYNGSEGAQPYQVQRANALWAKACGKPPYKKKAQYGFSIEGIIPIDGVIKDESSGIEILDKIDLDGVILTTRPAYTASYAEPVFKMFGIESPAKVKKAILNSLQQKIQEEEKQRDFWDLQWKLRDALDEAVKQTMTSNAFIDDNERREYVDKLFDEYKSLMMNAIFSNKIIFEENEDSNDSVAMLDIYNSKNKITKNSQIKNNAQKTVALLQNDLEETLKAFQKALKQI